jgi:hypothetical protein
MAQPILGGLPLPVDYPLEPPDHALRQLNSSTPITFSGCYTFFSTNVGFAPSDPMGLFTFFLAKMKLIMAFIREQDILQQVQSPVWYCMILLVEG